MDLLSEYDELLQGNDLYAQDIHDCSECPLYQHDCKGGWISGNGGNPIEPPCTSWSDDTIVFAGMYND